MQLNPFREAHRGLGRAQALRLSLVRLTLVLLAPFPGQVLAFPPVPPHQVYGVVRDQIGNPLENGAVVIFEAASGLKIRAGVDAQTEPSMNYRLEVPMDAGLTSDLYSPTALLPTAPFKLRVQIGTTTYLPIEMTADFSNLGAPGGRTRIDLTLGVDADGNGLPDAWEKAVAALLGQAWVQGGILPGDLYPGSGMTYREVYLAGTYAVAPKDGFTLQIVGGADARPKLAFTAVKGRSYAVQAAATLGEWINVPFRVIQAATDQGTIEVYQATSTQHVEFEAPELPGGSARFYRLILR